MDKGENGRWLRQPAPLADTDAEGGEGCGGVLGDQPVQAPVHVARFHAQLLEARHKACERALRAVPCWCCGVQGQAREAGQAWGKVQGARVGTEGQVAEPRQRLRCAADERCSLGVVVWGVAVDAQVEAFYATEAVT